MQNSANLFLVFLYQKVVCPRYNYKSYNTKKGLSPKIKFFFFLFQVSKFAFQFQKRIYQNFKFYFIENHLSTSPRNIQIQNIFYVVAPVKKELYYYIDKTQYIFYIVIIVQLQILLVSQID